MSPDYEQIASLVQKNCHISDARHAGDYTLCVYLLKMREYYRWEKEQAFSHSLSTDDIGKWLTQREALWDELGNEDYNNIQVNGDSYNPFNSIDINNALNDAGLVYSGGIGIKGKPHFFLADLEQKKTVSDYQILVAAKEYARDLTSPPAMSQEKTIYIRRESFKRMVWEKTEEWRWNKPENAMAKAMRCYNFDDQLEESLDLMTNNELDAAILHEIGEIKAGKVLNGWLEMMKNVTHTQAEIMARAAKDHFADCISTLPTLIEENKEASIHFYFANLTSMRKVIFPSLLKAYTNWQENNNTEELKNIIKEGASHWNMVTSKMLEINKEHEKNSHSYIESLVKDNYL